ncbi:MULTISPECIES: DUF2905 domain-containing protein [unclassified Prochlorococcus]|uniref:DUF2905 domain-containing protein n=1 Tax=unclassified Prochlorococcus TaxID=2627481 RepID=UPI000533B6D9|nr:MULTISPECIES: DUF2905 domain-containing protein [unclassified Prochlorococcus]KGG16111.1 hypothetical protein EV06_0820 [Prochlorococcus sp. MIT 0602]KGG17231.1 hypothetical protein EV07_0668 [Prochlorococcus sp. MIT 0603]
MQKIIIIIGLLITYIGILYPYIKRIRLGQLPGDIAIRGENLTFYFPVITCILISLILTVILNLISK